MEELFIPALIQDKILNKYENIYNETKKEIVENILEILTKKIEEKKIEEKNIKIII